MKKLFTTIMLLVFLCLPLSAQAGDCERYWDELVGRTFETIIGDIEYTVQFGDSVFGPCPCGTVILSYTDTQIIDDIEYSAIVEFEMEYTTSADVVTVAGIDFILHAGKLIMLPDDPLVLSIEND